MHPVQGVLVDLTRSDECMESLYIAIRRGNRFDRIVEIAEPEVVIGRRETCGIWLPDPRVSREHAVISISDAGICVRDLGSRNGTSLNGLPVLDHQRLQVGSEVSIGEYHLTLCLGLTAAIRASVNTDVSTLSKRDAAEILNEFKLDTASLTEAQRRVYTLFLEGQQEKEVAASLGISIHTVHGHAKAIYRILSVSTRAELISRWAKRQSRMS
jgi:pSer/pThr/pTyr-binding forkhead associated (FHA) protein